MEKERKDWTDAVGSKLREGRTKTPDALWAAIERDMPTAKPTLHTGRRVLRRAISAAAVVALLMAIGTIYYMTPHRQIMALKGDDTLEQKSVVALNATDPQPIETAARVAEQSSESMAQQPPKATTNPTSKHRAAQAEAEAGLPPQLAKDENTEVTPTSKSTTDRDVVPTQPTQIAEQERAQMQQKAEPSKGKMSIDQALASKVKRLRKGRDKWSVGLSTSGALAMVSSSQPGNMMTMSTPTLTPIDDQYMALSRNYGSYTYNHRQPLSFGLSASKSLGKGFAASVGVDYTLLRSKVSTSMGEAELNQTLQFIGIPLGINWSFVNRGGFALYVGGEVEAAKCIKAKFGEQSIKERGVQWAMAGVVGAQYNIAKQFAVYVEPKLSHYFNNTELRTIRNDKNIIFDLRLGLRLTY